MISFNKHIIQNISNKLLLLLSISSLIIPTLQAQESLPFEAYIQQIEQQHPLSQAIRLQQNKAQQILRATRGEQLDPKLESKWKFKQFNGYNYYNIYDAYLKIPTTWGLQFKAGYNGAEGYYLNNADNLPDAGQAYLGVELPLLQGLWNNKRQTALRQAKLLQKSATVEIQSALNELLYQASGCYWDWTLAAHQVRVYQENLELAKLQFQQLQSNYLQGAIPAIDTLKGFIRIQDFEIKWQDALLARQKAALALEANLWLENGQPAALPDSINPMSLDSLQAIPLDSSTLEQQLQRIDQHPDLQVYDYKLKALALERKYKNTKLLPKANISYNFLSANNVNFFENTGGIAAVTENYKLGLKFSYPILIRKERADLQLNQLKIKETTLKRTFKARSIRNKIRTYHQTIDNYALQLSTLKKMVQNYQLLVEAERQKFALGESDIFMVNTRQIQYVEAKLKYYKTAVKFLKAQTAWAWATANW